MMDYGFVKSPIPVLRYILRQSDVLEGTTPSSGFARLEIAC